MSDPWTLPDDVAGLAERVRLLEAEMDARDRAMHDLAAKVRAAERVGMHLDQRLAELAERLEVHIGEGGGR
jgi:hypothetical protein